MRQLARLFIGMGVVGLMPSASAQIRIVESHFGEDQVLLEFDQPMLGWDTAVGLRGLRFEPAFDCQWRWDDDLHLVCSPPLLGRKPAKATRYTLRIDGGLWSQQGEEIKPTSLDFDHDPPEVSTDLGEWKGGVPDVFLETDQPVDEAALREAVRVSTADGTALAYRLAQRPARDQRRRWHFELDAPDHRGPARIVVRPGLVGLSGPLRGTQDEMLIEYEHGEPFRYRGALCSPHSWNSSLTLVPMACPAGGGLTLGFSRPLSAAALDALEASAPKGLRLIRVAVPESGYGLVGGDRVTSPSWLVRFQIDDPGTTLDWRLPVDLRSRAGEALTGDAQLSLRSTDFQGRVEVPQARVVMLPGAEPPALLRQINLKKLEQRQLSFDGSDKARVSTATPKTAQDNRLHEVALAKRPSRAWLRDGGLIEGQVRVPGPWGGDAYSLINAPFHLASLHSQRQLLVWASAWKGHAGLAHVEIELLRLDGEHLQSIARAHTGADGVAILDLPAGIERKALLVRARQGREVVMLPLDSSISPRGDVGYWPSLSDGVEHQWGFTDKPLYRPGETVRYRLWFAERDANRLRLRDAGARTLVLESGWSDTIWQSWDTKIAVNGSVTGEFVLPRDARDDRFCIRGKDASGSEGACFTVANFHSSALWAEVRAERTLVHDGEDIAVEVEGGYYSGGPAAGALVEPMNLLLPLRLEEAYPQHAGYQFIDPYDNETADGGESFRGSERMFESLGADGRKRIVIPAINPRVDAAAGRLGIPFGRLQVNASVSVSASTSTMSSTAELRFSRHRAFVGLRLDKQPDIDRDAELTAIVIDAEGRALEDGKAVEVEIVATPEGHRASRDPDAVSEKILARCTLKPAQSTPCAFRAQESGLYRFRARREGAAAVEIDEYVRARRIDDVDARQPDTTLVREGDAVLLSQPFARAKVLFAAQHARVLKHWIVDVDTPGYRFALPPGEDWAPGYTLGALVLDADAGARTAGGAGATLRTASVEIDVPRALASPLRIEVPKGPVAPGSAITLRLANRGTLPLDATVAVVDEALRVLATEEVAGQDPQSETWLGALKEWHVPDWSALREWLPIGDAPSARKPVSPRSNLVTWPAEKQPRSRSLRATEEALPNVDAYMGGSENLETIVVTGSRIGAVDIFPKGTQHDRSLQPSSPQNGIGGDSRLRQRYLDTAYWNPSVAIAPGGTEALQLNLPDNLTRWKVVVWSNDGRDFHLDEADLTAGLPVEVRTETPVRLYPGDRSDVAVSARNRTGKPALVEVSLQAQGAGVDVREAASSRAAADHEQRVTTLLAPSTEGTIELVGRANAGVQVDGVRSVIPVETSIGRERVALAGWFGEGEVELQRPAIPPGADDVRVQLNVHRDFDGLVEGWIRGLHDYPHGCWEQQLSRAIGAAAALRIGRPELWPEADTLIAETLANAPAFQDDGLFSFFVGDIGAVPDPVLSAYSLQALEVLKEWGHAVPTPLLESTREALVDWVGDLPEPKDRALTPSEWATLASWLALDPKAEGSAERLDQALTAWPKLDAYASSRLVLAMHARGTRAFADRRAQLADAAPLRGMRRVLRSRGDRSFILGSDLRDQCGVIDALQRSGSERARLDEWRRGLVDQYAGGVDTVDSQASAQCLLAAVGTERRRPGRTASRVTVQGATASTEVILPVEASAASWEASWPHDGTPLRLSASGGDGLLGFTGEVSYRVDQRQSKASASGFGIEREYAVLTGGEWKRVDAEAVPDGSWVRVHLGINTSAMRYHVAVVDSVPGGLRPEDLSLDRVAGVEMRDADLGTPWFENRQLVDTEARFYAERLPPGAHDLYYYARAVHPGDFLALPARAELMYGKASVARTAATRLRVGSEPLTSEKQP